MKASRLELRIKGKYSLSLRFASLRIHTDIKKRDQCIIPGQNARMSPKRKSRVLRATVGAT